MSVYFIQAGLAGAVKVGFSGDVVGRLKSLQTGHSVKLHLLGYVPGSVLDERRVHFRLEKHRLHGEWFEPSELTLDTIGTVMGMGCVDPSWPLTIEEVGRKSGHGIGKTPAMNFRIPRSMQNAVRDRAKQNNESVTDVVLRAFAEYTK